MFYSRNIILSSMVLFYSMLAVAETSTIENPSGLIIAAVDLDQASLVNSEAKKIQANEAEEISKNKHQLAAINFEKERQYVMELPTWDNKKVIEYTLEPVVKTKPRFYTPQNATKPRDEKKWTKNIVAGAEIQQDSSAGNSQFLGMTVKGPIFNEDTKLELKGQFLNRESSQRLLPINEEKYTELTTKRPRDPRRGQGSDLNLSAHLMTMVNENHHLWFKAAWQNEVDYNDDSRLANRDDSAKEKYYGYGDELKTARQSISLGHNWNLGNARLKSSLDYIRTDYRGRTVPSWLESEAVWEKFEGKYFISSYKHKSYRGKEFMKYYEVGDMREIKSQDIGFKTQYEFDWLKHNSSIGLQYVRSEFADGLVTPLFGKFVDNRWALTASDIWHLNPELTWTNNIVFNYDGQYKGHVSPATYLVWQPNSNWTFKGGITTHYLAPSKALTEDAIVDFTKNTSPIFGNPNLKAQKGINYELGMAYQNSVIDINMDMFYNQYKNRIVLNDDVICASREMDKVCQKLVNFNPDTYPFDQYINLPKAENKGFEINGKFHINPLWDITASYVFQKSKIKSGLFKDQEDLLIPKHAINLMTQYQFTDKFSMWFDVEYRSGRKRNHLRNYPKQPVFGGAPALQDYEDDIKKFNAGNNWFKPYVLFGLGGEYQISKNLKVKGAIYNLFDKKYNKIDTYQVNYAGNEVTEGVALYSSIGGSNVGNYIDRRRFTLSVSYDF